LPKEEVQVGDLVKVRFSAYKFGSLPRALRKIPYDELAFVLDVRGSACVVIFTYPEQRIMSFLKSQLEVVSKIETALYETLTGSYIFSKEGDLDDQ
jgi:hypothetical protein